MTLSEADQEELKASYTRSLRPHTLVAEGLIHMQLAVGNGIITLSEADQEELKASYTSSLRPHTLVAEGRIH
jgi:acyl-coenzyme A thioesterase PaaI-like protein